MVEEPQYSSGGDYSLAKRKYDDSATPPPPSFGRRPTRFSAPIIHSQSPDSGSAYNSVPPPVDKIEISKQKAQETVARIFNSAEAKRPKFENGGEYDSNDSKGFSSANSEPRGVKMLKTETTKACLVDKFENQKIAAMASANWLHSSTVSHAIIPTTTTTTNPRRNFPVTTFRPTTSSDVRSLFNSSHQFKPPAMAVQAQAKRGFSQKLEVEAATPADMQFEAPLKIVMYPDPILRAKNKRVVTFDENLKKLVDEMFDVMYKTEGIGLSAPQVGVNVQLMVFNPVGVRGEGEELVLVNPRVVNFSKKLVPFTEGCLSFPGINADVVRPEAVKVDCQDISGERFTVSLSRLPSRVFQHEFDHLEGILFFDRMTAEVVDSIRTELQDLEKKYEDRTGLPRPESIESRKRWKAAAGFGRS